jgi:hypothetical protein
MLLELGRLRLCLDSAVHAPYPARPIRSRAPIFSGGHARRHASIAVRVVREYAALEGGGALVVVRLRGHSAKGIARGLVTLGYRNPGLVNVVGGPRLTLRVVGRVHMISTITPDGTARPTETITMNWIGGG